MRNTFSKLLLLMMLGNGIISSFAQDKDLSNSPFSPDSPIENIKTISGKHIPVNRLNEFIRRAMDSVGMPGLSIAIINDAEIVYHRSFGITNVETKEPVTDNTIFEAASLSKPVFAYFVMKMVGKGRLDLDKPVYQYLPHPGIDSASQDNYRLITPRMILSHSTGFPNWSHGKPITLSFKPGTGFSYSGEAYQYLAAVIGTLLDVGWEAKLDSVFQQEVAFPLNLKHSFFTWNDYIAGHKATGHKQGKITDAMQHGKAFGAGYSLHTEAADYAGFLVEMIKSDHLNKELRDEMLKAQNEFPPDHELVATGQTGWGLGFARRPTPHGMRYLHTGNNHDFQSYCCFYKEKKYGLVFFTNSDKIEPFYERLGKFLEDEF